MSIKDDYPDYGSTLESVEHHAFVITPNDAADLPEVTRGIYVGTAGDLRVRLIGDTDPVTYRNLPVGRHGMRVARVYATGTTAADLLGLV